jgi:uncharacterized membrane protein YidH (DUF202 family)
MMENREVAILLIGAGVVAILVGLLVLAGGLSWFGRLPGDIRIERENTRVFIPITTMIVLSIGLTLLMAVIRRLF